jgi:hypothetical protein
MSILWNLYSGLPSHQLQSGQEHLNYVLECAVEEMHEKIVAGVPVADCVKEVINTMKAELRSIAMQRFLADESTNYFKVIDHVERIMVDDYMYRSIHINVDGSVTGI